MFQWIQLLDYNFPVVVELRFIGSGSINACIWIKHGRILLHRGAREGDSCPGPIRFLCLRSEPACAQRCHGFRRDREGSFRGEVEIGRAAGRKFLCINKTVNNPRGRSSCQKPNSGKAMRDERARSRWRSTTYSHNDPENSYQLLPKQRFFPSVAYRYSKLNAISSI